VKVELRAYGVEGVAEGRHGVVELTAHLGPLAALTREQEREHASVPRLARDEVGRRDAAGDGGEALEEGGPIAGDDDGAVLEVGAVGGERMGDIDDAEVGMRLEVEAKLFGLRPHRPFGLGGDDEGERPWLWPAVGPSGRRCSKLEGRRRLLEDEVSVGAADTEGETAARRGAPFLRQGTGSLRSWTVPADQSTCGEGFSAWRVFGRRPCSMASTILMMPATPAAAWV
jgi:hypothetical protein